MAAHSRRVPRGRMVEQRLVLPVHLVGAHAVREQRPKRVRLHQIPLTARVDRRHAKASAEQAREQIWTVGAHRERRADAVCIACGSAATRFSRSSSCSIQVVS